MVMMTTKTFLFLRENRKTIGVSENVEYIEEGCIDVEIR
jgi:hypothetical protein